MMNDELREQRKQYTAKIEVLFAKHVRMRDNRHYVGSRIQVNNAM